jgi:hypothetical protein
MTAKQMATAAKAKPAQTVRLVSGFTRQLALALKSPVALFCLQCNL